MSAFAQGVILGAVLQGVKVSGRSYAGGWWDWLSPFSLLTGASVVAAYALLGACWLIWRKEGAVQDNAYRMAWRGGAAREGETAAKAASIAPARRGAIAARAARRARCAPGRAQGVVLCAAAAARHGNEGAAAVERRGAAAAGSRARRAARGAQCRNCKGGYTVIVEEYSEGGGAAARAARASAARAARERHADQRAARGRRVAAWREQAGSRERGLRGKEGGVGQDCDKREQTWAHLRARASRERCVRISSSQ